jgi:tuftelin-interacting protein 11
MEGMMPPTVSLQKRRRVRRVTRVLDQNAAQSTHTAHVLEHILISLLCRTPTFVSKGTKEIVTPQEDEEDAMDEDGESIEDDSSSDSGDDESDIPVFGSRRKREILEEDEEEYPPTRGLGAFKRKGLGMDSTNEVPAVTPESEPEPRRDSGIGFKRGIGLPSTLSSEEPVTIPTDHRGIGARPPLLHANDSSSMSTESLPTSFGAPRTQRAFVRATPTNATPIPKAELSTEERTHFTKISGSVGAKLMAKMGWSAVSLPPL